MGEVMMAYGLGIEVSLEVAEDGNRSREDGDGQMTRRTALQLCDKMTV